MQIGLIDVDSHNWPNLCLMKLSAWHKARGDHVEWWRPEGRYDLVYKSKVFTDLYSKDTAVITNAEQVIAGGTGYGLENRLPEAVEHSFPNAQHLSAVFRHRIRLFKPRLSAKLRILYCQQEGGPPLCGRWRISRSSGAASGKSNCWTPNLLACPDHARLLEQLAASRAWVDFTQGLDIRLVTPDNTALLNRVRTKAVHFAWDNPHEDLTPCFRRFLEWTNIRDKRKRQVYVLTNFGAPTHRICTG